MSEHPVAPSGVPVRGARSKAGGRSRVAQHAAATDERWFSFDVFDTVLIRSVIPPEAAFSLLGRDVRDGGLVSMDPESFAEARTIAGMAAGRPTLDGIYSELALNLHLTDAVAEEMKRREIELEQRLVVPNPGELRRIEQARRRGRILFLSDMHLPTEVIRGMLARCGALQPGDALLVSCEAGASKRSGELFAVAAKLLGFVPSSATHRGNDRVVDVDRALGSGWAAQFAPDGNPTPGEKQLSQTRATTGGLGAALAGAARLARLQLPTTDRSEAALRDSAAQVAAPVLVSYVLWVLRQSEHQGIGVLYFLAREGQLLFEIAQILAESLPDPPELHYLMCSRSSLNLAAVGRPTPTKLAWAASHASALSSAELASCLGLDAGELEAVSRQREAARQQDDPTGWQWMVGTLCEEPYASKIEAASAQRRRGALIYLRRIGFLDRDHAGVVDTTGSGSQMWALDQLRGMSDRSPAPGFLAYRLKGPTLAATGAIEAAGAPRIHAWLNDGVAGRGLGRPTGAAELLELFCRADHARVIGYEPDSGEPIVDPDGWTEDDRRLQVVRDAVRSVAHELVIDRRYVDLDADLRRLADGRLRRLWIEPTVDEAQAWGSWGYETSPGGRDRVPIAPPLTFTQLVAGARRGVLRGPNWFSWQSASIQRSSPPLRLILVSARSLRTRLRRVARVRWKRRFDSARL